MSYQLTSYLAGKITVAEQGSSTTVELPIGDVKSLLEDIQRGTLERHKLQGTVEAYINIIERLIEK
ncbi:hypothetical protein N9980_00810 [bacterium]|nr:hypothetical protein [bacterium]